MYPQTPATPSAPPRFCPACGRADDAPESPLCRLCGSTLEVQGYCPICESRVRRRAGELCPKHDIELLAEGASAPSPLSEDAAVSWVTVQLFPDSLAVAGARIRLEAEGIPTFVEGERMGAPSMYTVATGGVKLQVPCEYAADARIILSQDWSWPDDELGLKDEDPEDFPGTVQEVDSPRAFWIELIAVLALAVPLIAAALAYLRAE